MLWNEIISSICIYCSATIFSISLQGQTKLKILFIQMFASLLYLMSYLFVLNINSAALIGAITATFEIVRLLVFYFLEKNEKFNTRKINLIAMISFSIILIVCTILNWAGWISILPLISAILVSLALGNKNVLIIKIAFIIQAALITTYLLLLTLWINAASQIFVFIFGIIGLFIFIHKNKLNKQVDENI
jgi:hypothetical protein